MVVKIEYWTLHYHFLHRTSLLALLLFFFPFTFLHQNMCGTFLQIMLQAMMMSSWKCSRRDVFKVRCITIDLFLVFKIKFTIDVYNPLFVLSLTHLQTPLGQLQTWGPLNTKGHLDLPALAVLQSQTMLCTFFHLFAQPDLALHLLARCTCHPCNALPCMPMSRLRTFCQHFCSKPGRAFRNQANCSEKHFYVIITLDLTVV